MLTFDGLFEKICYYEKYDYSIESKKVVITLDEVLEQAIMIDLKNNNVDCSNENRSFDFKSGKVSIDNKHIIRFNYMIDNERGRGGYIFAPRIRYGFDTEAKTLVIQSDEEKIKENGEMHDSN